MVERRIRSFRVYDTLLKAFLESDNKIYYCLRLSDSAQQIKGIQKCGIDEMNFSKKVDS